jgi:hypothetical protein
MSPFLALSMTAFCISVEDATPYAENAGGARLSSVAVVEGLRLF